MLLNYIKIYLKESISLLKKNPDNFNFWLLVYFFFNWYKSQELHNDTLQYDQPWLTFASIKFLKSILNSEMRVYEYGVGGSTIFFVKRVKEVISVEHDYDWFIKVSEVIKKKGFTNWQGNLCQPRSNSIIQFSDTSDPHSYISSDLYFQGKSFQDYAMNIDNYPDKYFDLILIDGRARPSCFYHAFKKVKDNGFLVLDNSEREHYNYIRQTLTNEGWKNYIFYGSGPYISYFWQTSIWQKFKS